jgi:hypothetical protein
MRKADAGYLAAMIDGEGCIGLYKTKRGYVNGTVQVSNTSRSLLESLIETAGVGRITTKSEPRINRKPVYSWTICQRQAKSLLLAVMPHIRLKRPQARLFCSFIGSWRPSYRLTEADRLFFDKVLRKMRELNRRGPA